MSEDMLDNRDTVTWEYGIQQAEFDRQFTLENESSEEPVDSSGVVNEESTKADEHASTSLTATVTQGKTRSFWMGEEFWIWFPALYLFIFPLQ